MRPKKKQVVFGLAIVILVLIQACYADLAPFCRLFEKPSAESSVRIGIYVQSAEDAQMAVDNWPYLSSGGQLLPQNSVFAILAPPGARQFFESLRDTAASHAAETIEPANADDMAEAIAILSPLGSSFVQLPPLAGKTERLLEVMQRLVQTASGSANEKLTALVIPAQTLIVSDNFCKLALDLETAQTSLLAGTVSESSQQLARHGVFAYLGAGILFNKQLLATPGLATCVKVLPLQIPEDQGLMACINQTNSKNPSNQLVLKQVAGMHQGDFTGDATGWIEGVVAKGPSPITIHNTRGFAIEKQSSNYVPWLIRTSLLSFPHHLLLQKFTWNDMSLGLRFDMVFGFSTRISFSDLNLGASLERVARTWRGWNSKLLLDDEYDRFNPIDPWELSCLFVRYRTEAVIPSFSLLPQPYPDLHMRLEEKGSISYFRCGSDQRPRGLPGLLVIQLVPKNIEDELVYDKNMVHDKADILSARMESDRIVIQLGY